jgi:hypothetical protein
MSLNDIFFMKKEEYFNPDQGDRFCWVSGIISQPIKPAKEKKHNADNKQKNAAASVGA